MNTSKTSFAIVLIGSFFLGTSTPLSADFVSMVKMCESCHGKDGISVDPEVPIIAGFSYEGFLNTIDVFRHNERIALNYQRPGEPETVMNDIAHSLTDKDAEALADYFSNRPFVSAPQKADEEQAMRGAILHKQKCERCHRGNGKAPVMSAAILAGQWTPYLRRQFSNILEGKRIIPRSMLRRLRDMPAEDIEALLNFYALEGSKKNEH